MRRLALLVAIASLAPAASQTCGGSLSIPLQRLVTHTYTGTPVDTLYSESAASYEVTALAITGGGTGHGRPPRIVGRPSPEALRAAHPELAVLTDSLGSPFDGLFSPHDDLRTWTRCGFALLRYTLTIHTGASPPPVMVLDLYNVPPHVPIEAEAPIIVRPGRWSFDFEDGLPLRPESLRREPAK